LWRRSADLVIVEFGATPAAGYSAFYRLKLVDPSCNTKYNHQRILVPVFIPKPWLQPCLGASCSS